MYFVHSFHAVPDKKEHILAGANYAGIDFCSVIQVENVIGCQFHPELSSADGLKIYQTFLEK